MQTLLIAELSDREFGASVLNVSDFRRWLESKRLSVVTIPTIADYEFLHIETLLVAIERGATEGLSMEEAANIVQNIPSLAADRMAKRSARWLLGAEAHKQWRSKIAEAIKKGELIPLDLGSKLPLKDEQSAKPLDSQGKKWTDDRLRALREESLLPGSTNQALAKKYGVTRQRIGTLLGQAKKIFDKKIKDTKPSYGISRRGIKDGEKY